MGLNPLVSNVPMYLGDNLIGSGIGAFRETFEKSNADANMLPHRSETFKLSTAIPR
jgi:hypothetical protein